MPVNTPAPEPAPDPIGGLIFWTFLIVAAYWAFCTYKVAVKAGSDNAWFAFIPIANFFLLCEISGNPTWWILLCFVPYAGIFVWMALWIGLAEALCEDAPRKYLMCVPGINVFYISYLAFRKEPTHYKTPTFY